MTKTSLNNSTKTIVIRTNAGERTGIGHLVRSIQLAKELRKNKIDIIFILDFLELNISPFLIEFETICLYNSLQLEIDQTRDAELFLKKIENIQPDYVILDDYRIDKVWETIISLNHHKLLVIDDILRDHVCDIIVDMKWRGKQTYTRYDNLVPEHTTKLLGPAYTLLAESYRSNNLAVSNDNSDTFNIMIGVGGRGDLTLCKQFIEALLKKQSIFIKPLKLMVVLGPLSENSQSLVNEYHDLKNISILIGKTDLFPYLSETHLYIGAAGGTLYQLLALKIPALTFPIAENQESEKQQLEDIGHYFHLDSFTLSDCQNLPAFAKTVSDNYPRFKTLISQSKLVVDGFGSQRVTEQIISNTQKSSTSGATLQNKRKILSKSYSLSDTHDIREVDDEDINHYVVSRNLPSNCQNMITVEKLPFLPHYSWWFTAKRDSYLLSKDKTPCLYIWHEVKQYKQQDFLIGGWFVCQENIGFQEALLALSWQLKYCQEHMPNTPWIAVIHRENNFVKLLNKYVGFEDVGLDHAYSSAIQTIFDSASFDDFYYVTFNAQK